MPVLPLAVHAGEYGDYFYIVKSGLAMVKTDPRGPYRGKEFGLMPGSYFGEEALVGGAVTGWRSEPGLMPLR